MAAGAHLRAISLTQARAVGRFYGLAIVDLEECTGLSGSPERSQARCAARDASGRVYVVERFSPDQFAHKARIAHTVAHLASHGLRSAIPYLFDYSGECLVRLDGCLWQVAAYLGSVTLPRPAWVRDSWRGRAFARVLLNLRAASENLPQALVGAPFDLAGYVHDLVSTAQRHRPAVARELEPIANELGPYLSALDALPIAFCHGDVHPLNVIWSDDDIRALIDWEFCGYKPALYDVAALVSSVGIEEPDGLCGALVRQLLAALGGAGFADGKSWRHLVDLVLAIRFAWMSEWLRKDDAEMIALELDYMRLLLRERERLQALWLDWAGLESVA